MSCKDMVILAQATGWPSAKRSSSLLRPGWMEIASPPSLKSCRRSCKFWAVLDSADLTQVLTWYRARTADTAPLWQLLWPLELYLIRGELGKEERENIRGCPCLVRNCKWDFLSSGSWVLTPHILIYLHSEVMQGWGVTTEKDGNMSPGPFDFCPLTVPSLERQLFPPPSIHLLQH